MNLQRRCLCLLSGLLAVLAASGAQSETKDPPDNGIFVDAKIYDTRTLQNLLLTLSGRLGQVSGIDQGSLISRLGTLQGASSTQTAFSLQATALPNPSVATTNATATPSIVQTNGGSSTNGTPQTVSTTGGTTTSAGQTVTTTVSNTTGTTNSTVTTTPSNTNQTVTTMPAVTPAPSPLPAPTPFANPSSFSVSALDTLNEEMQLSYQIINLQLLLQGALSDDYTPGGLGRRHVTFGFPIYVSTPNDYRSDAAEVEVSVCNPPGVEESTPPTVQTIIPQEKTYNVASIVGKTGGLGAGAVVGNVVNIGANFSWTHQTFYMVKQQDTVALVRTAKVNPPCPDGNAPATFAWQFRPVLGQKTIDQGARSTFAQIAFSPSSQKPESSLQTQVAVRTCWREYHKKSGIVGDRIDGSCDPALDRPARIIPVSTAYNTTKILAIEPTDNGDGTITVKVRGRFPSGTRVGLGETSMDESVAGFENTGALVRFTAPTQLLALRGARLLSPDGKDTDVWLTGRYDEPGQPFDNKAGVIVNPSGDSLIFVPWDTTRIPVVHDGGEPVKVDPVFGAGIVIRQPAGLDKDWKSRLIFVRSIRRAEPEECRLPFAGGPEYPATVRPYSDTLAQVIVPLYTCPEVGPPQLPRMYVAILGGKAFGLSDSPFNSFDADQLTILVPKTFLQGEKTLRLKRLFLDNQYETNYRLVPSAVSYTGISVARATKLGATFAITGSSLTQAMFEFPWQRPVICCDTFALVTLSTDELASVKQLVLAPHDGSSPLLIPLPAVTKPSDDSEDDTKTKFPISIVQSDEKTTTYAIVAIAGVPSLEGATVIQPVVPQSDVKKRDDRNLWFSLPTPTVKSYKEVAIQLADPIGKPAGTIIVTLPTPAKATDDASANNKLGLTDDPVGLKQGAAGPYTIKGSSLKLVFSIKYLGAEPSLHYAKDYSSVTIDQLPAGFTANVGKSPLEFALTDGTKQMYGVTITK